MASKPRENILGKEVETDMNNYEKLKNRYDKQVAENQVLRAKLKGYETLGQLHQDAKNELKAYKKKYGPITEVDKAYQKARSQSSSADAQCGSDPSGSGHSGYTVQQEKEPAGTATASSSASGSVISQPSGTSQPNGHPAKLKPRSQLKKLSEEVEEDSDSLTEAELENEKKKSSGDHSAEHLGFILPSMSSGQSISSGDLHTPSQPGSSGQSSDQLAAQGGAEIQGNDQMPGSFDRLQLAQSLHKSGRTFSLPESIEVSMHVPQVATVLHKFTGNGDETSVAMDLARISLHMVKVEKENKQYKSLVSALSAENSDLKNRIPERDRTINELRQENGKLKQTVIKLQQERHARSTSSLASDDWVTVTKQGESEEEQAQRQSHTEVQALERRLAKIVSQRNELLEVNHKWSADYGKLQQEYQQEVLQLGQQLNEAQQQLAAHVSMEGKRQRDIDSLLLSAKKRTEIEETAKEEALQLLHLERQKRQTLEEQLLVIGSGVQQTGRESKPWDGLTRRNKIQTGPASSSDVESMRNEITALLQQVAMFREDFEQERRDRERIQAEKISLEEASDRLKEQLTNRDQKVEDLKEEVTLKRDQVRLLERQIRDMQNIQQSGPLMAGGRSSSTGSAASQNKWPCQSCTYLNASSRTVCEVCGSTRSYHGSGYRSSSCSQIPASIPQRRLQPRGEDVMDEVFEDSSPFIEE
ncbi:TNFAIP3-interacting protein 1 [Lingula anatina]|uniref:TNFAIP3-interacting protein 1 n=1 Tax=Lingula anatina TaxID=7574 RepID=A0A1S3JXZ4_LINAN|nr:TNFAIP3-interacting protein 1 [Lingula anatina]XP_013414925.1 TNFAIP3-interacting protein 1 [Lingula anatina]|eukprot:XP_013414924.1 TNFAIP3-interacting protein 1 [Lingula anatina]